MIIKCEKCLTRFRLDDSRVTDKGVKDRCTKCKSVFTVHKEIPDAEDFEPEVPVLVAAPNDEEVTTSEVHSFSPEPVPSFSFDPVVSDETTAFRGSAGFDSFETSSFELSERSFASEERHDTALASDISAPFESTTAAADDVDFSSFDFGDSPAKADLTPQPTTLTVDDFTESTGESISTPLKEAPQGLDFSDDDMFGAVVPDAPEVTSDTISFDFGEDSFAESMDMGSQDSGGKSNSLFALDSPGDSPFNLGEIDFGDELTSVAVQQVNPEDLKPSQEILFAPLAQAQFKANVEPVVNVTPADQLSADALHQDLPPLSIASRRQQNPFFGVMIAVVALFVIGVLGYFGYSSFYSSNDATSPDAGKIVVRAVTATYVDNDAAGELLVISGEALNEFSTPRAALQVKVTVFDSMGQSIATKSSYGGNPLSEEQLESMSLEKIEAAMANQFGDSLANMEVAPGKAIPFVIVLANLPKGAKDFDVQSAGSTVATGKQ